MFSKEKHAHGEKPVSGTTSTLTGPGAKTTAQNAATLPACQKKKTTKKKPKQQSERAITVGEKSSDAFNFFLTKKFFNKVAARPS